MTTVNNTTGTGTNTQTGTTTVGPKLDQNYTDFLRLLTTQLQNQDPTAPADTNDLTQQIATLSQVEQQISMNNSLQELINLFTANQTFSAVSYIGRQVETEGNKGYLDNGEAAFVYNLPEGVDETTLTILDSSGNVAYESVGTTFAGRNQVIWNGKNKDEEALPEGIYTISVVAKDSSGKVMEGVTTRTTGIVRSVDTQDGKSTLAMGDGFSIGVDEVLSIRVPGV